MSIFAWLILPLLLLAAYPWASWLTAHDDRRDIWTVLSLTLALGTGALTLIMFGLGLLVGGFSLVGVTLIYLLVMASGWVLHVQNRRAYRQPAEIRGESSAHAASAARPVRSIITPHGLITLLIVVIAAAILFNAAYWPFSRADTLGIYHPQAQTLSSTHTLIPLTGADSLYRAYPMNIQLSYAYVYLLAGWENEYLARVWSTLLSLGCLPLTYALGRRLGGALVGIASVTLLALTPTFARWAATGYVDLPTAFYFGLSALFAQRFYESRHWRDALLTGALMGLAVWTKNAALIGVPVVLAWFGYCWLSCRRDWRQTALGVTAMTVIAAPWYVRNWLGAGFIMPETAWTDEAARTLDSLLILVTHPEIYGLPGWLLLAGLLLTLAGALGPRRGNSPVSILLALWTLPFFVMWFVFASYDPRFLLIILPLLAVCGGRLVAFSAERLTDIWRRRLVLPVLLVVLILAAQVTWISVEHKDDILRDPFMSAAAKQVIVGRGE